VVSILRRKGIFWGCKKECMLAERRGERPAQAHFGKKERSPRWGAVNLGRWGGEGATIRAQLAK